MNKEQLDAAAWRAARRIVHGEQTGETLQDKMRRVMWEIVMTVRYCEGCDNGEALKKNVTGMNRNTQPAGLHQ